MFAVLPVWGRGFHTLFVHRPDLLKEALNLLPNIGPTVAVLLLRVIRSYGVE